MRTGRVFGTFVAVVMVVSSALVATPADGGPQPGSVDAQVLGQIEARGWESASSAGRSTNAADPTSGLSRPDPTPTLLSEPTAEPTATAQPPELTALTEQPRVTSQRAAAGIEFEALEMIPYDWRERLPGWRIRFQGGRDDVRGLTYSAERVIEVYVRAGDTPWDIARVVAHELGHAVDLTHATDSVREEWREQRNIDEDVPWWPGSAAPDFATGAGDFAECFASWQVGSTSLSQVAGECTEADVAAVAAVS